MIRSRMMSAPPDRSLRLSCGAVLPTPGCRRIASYGYRIASRVIDETLETEHSARQLKRDLRAGTRL
ncbi:protein of unknown function [Methylorubrum extorquens]|uniref:Uncharacterized protein n=1 Tax=Methylorubrum extorquens TaxID=408 RepID=A0A2N9ASA7_METEX|nr:protein of unknown function [Methylorubrum extorquens]